jgi:protein SCO1/2
MSGMDALRKNWVPLVIALAVIAVVAVLLFWPGKSKLDFKMQNLDGETVTLGNTSGKARLVYFYFGHCPDVCLGTNYLLSQVQEGLKEAGVFGNKTLLLSITFDPERDTTEYLKEYSSRMEADSSGWYFLRDDDVEKSRKLAEAYGVSIIPDGDNFIHANLFTLLDGKGKVQKVYSPNEVLVINPDKREEFIEQIVQDMVSLVK